MVYKMVDEPAKCDQPSQRADKQEVKDSMTNLCSSLEQMNFLLHINLFPGLQGVECAAIHLEYCVEVLVRQVLLWKWERTAISITITMKMCVERHGSLYSTKETA